MTTPTWITGFEHGVISTNGGGLFSAISGSPTIDSVTKRTGNYALKLAPVGTGAENVRRNQSASQQIAVARIYFMIPSGGLPSANSILMGWQITTAATTVGINVTTAGVLRGVVGGGSVATGPTLSVDTWYQLDMRVDLTGTTWTLDWSIDGVAQTQATWAGQATNDALTYLRLGSSSTSATYTIYFDDVVVSETGADFPIGAGGVELLSPDADGTHNAGTNIMEDQSGTDIGAVSAFSLLNSIPMGNVTNYLRQLANGSGNYAEVTFGDIQSTHTTIDGAMAILCYTSETTSANNGGCIMSKDNFSTQMVVKGSDSAPVDYSDGSTASPFFTSAILSQAIDDTTVNALKARMGFSTDASPDPYWIDLAVEVAFSTESSNVSVSVSAGAIAIGGRTVGVLSVVSVPVSAAALAAGAQASTVVPVTNIPINPGALAVGGQTVTPLGGPISISISAAAIAAAAQSVVVAAVSIVPVLAAQLVAAAHAVTVIANAIISVVRAQLAAGPSAASVVPGMYTVPVTAAALAADPRAASIVSNVSLSINAGAVLLHGRLVTVRPGAIVLPISAGALAAAGLSGAVVPGTAQVSVLPGALVIAGRSVQPGTLTQVAISAGQLVLAGRSGSVVPGVRKVTLLAAQLLAAGQTVTVLPGARSVSLRAARAVFEGFTVTVRPGLRLVPISSAALVAAGLAGSVIPGARLITTLATPLVAAGQFVLVVPGARSIAVSAAQLAGAGSPVSVLSSVGIPIAAGQLVLTGLAGSVVPGARSVPIGAAQLSLVGLGVDVSALIVYVTLTLPMYIVTEIQAREEFIK